MTSKEEQQRRRELLAELKQNQRAQKLATLPVPAEDLQALFNFLDEELEAGCNDSLRLTQRFAQERGLDFEKLETWLSEHGGYCDCEVLANVEPEFEDLL